MPFSVAYVFELFLVAVIFKKQIDFKYKEALKTSLVLAQIEGFTVIFGIIVVVVDFKVVEEVVVGFTVVDDVVIGVVDRLDVEVPGSAVVVKIEEDFKVVTEAVSDFIVEDEVVEFESSKDACFVVVTASGFKVVEFILQTH